jgi:uncharacterized protein YecE (DUF72 family)
MGIYIGTSGYSYREWKGSFYPRDLSNNSMLRFYAERFNSVEANSTFRGTPEVSAVQSWAEQVPTQFKFALKAPFQITHRKRLKGSRKLLAEFLAVASALKRRLGPVLFQLPPNFKKDLPRLRRFLALVPTRTRIAFEFRHPSWFDDDVFALLRTHRAALCIADTEDLPTPFMATAKWGYLRLRRERYTQNQLLKWAEGILTQNWRDVFIYFRHEKTGTGPRYANRLSRLLQSH